MGFDRWSVVDAGFDAGLDRRSAVDALAGRGFDRWSAVDALVDVGFDRYAAAAEVAAAIGTSMASTVTAHWPGVDALAGMGLDRYAAAAEVAAAIGSPMASTVTTHWPGVDALAGVGFDRWSAVDALVGAGFDRWSAVDALVDAGLDRYAAAAEVAAALGGPMASTLTAHWPDVHAVAGMGTDRWSSVGAVSDGYPFPLRGSTGVDGCPTAAQPRRYAGEDVSSSRRRHDVECFGVLVVAALVVAISPTPVTTAITRGFLETTGFALEAAATAYDKVAALRGLIIVLGLAAVIDQFQRRVD